MNLLLFLLWILPLTLGDTHVTCVYSEECMLPCTSNFIEIIHWIGIKDATVHSFYHNADQLEYQSGEYKGRTSLLPQSEINKGNVSLLLKNIQLKDEGRYKCYTANDKTNNEQYVSVSVEVPVKSVNITLGNEKVTCSTSGVYPEPNVVWSPVPLKEPSNTSKKTEENLFTVTSILDVGAIPDTYKYICSITNKDRTKTRYTATLEQEPPTTLDKLNFECPATKSFHYTLTFSSNTILKYDSNTSTDDIPEHWRGKITVNRENGFIKVHLNEEQLGTYTWDCSTDQHKLIKTTLLQKDVKTHLITLAVFAVIFIILIIAAIILIVKRKKMSTEIQRRSRDRTI